MKNPFASRKFVIAVIFLAVQAITFFTPDDIDRKIEAIAPYTALVAVAAITGTTIEDSAKAWAQRPGTIRDALQDVLDDTFPTVDAEPAELVPSSVPILTYSDVKQAASEAFNESRDNPLAGAKG